VSVCRCESCERQVDTDFELGEEINDKFYCELCAEKEGLQHDESLHTSEDKR